MALYLYECPECGHRSEMKHSMEVEPTIHCDRCLDEGEVVEMDRQITPPAGLHFKGPGFYENDYKDKN